jgi:hypothetical protein
MENVGQYIYRLEAIENVAQCMTRTHPPAHTEWHQLVERIAGCGHTLWVLHKLVRRGRGGSQTYFLVLMLPFLCVTVINGKKNPTT